MVMLDPQFGIPTEIKFLPEERQRNSYKVINRNDHSTFPEKVSAPPPAAVKKMKNSSRNRTQNEILSFSLIPDEDDEKHFRKQTWRPYSPEYLGEELLPKCRFQGSI
jgi:hypothetical protein